MDPLELASKEDHILCMRYNLGLLFIQRPRHAGESPDKTNTRTMKKKSRKERSKKLKPVTLQKPRPGGDSIEVFEVLEMILEYRNRKSG